MNDSIKTSITSLLSSANIPAKVLVLGRTVYVDCANCHGDRVQLAFLGAGFAIRRAYDGTHLDGYKGLRISAQLPKAA
jgi:hypothetical protein